MQDIFPNIDEWGPEKIVVVSDAKTGMKGVLVIDNTARGMGKGGTRMSPTLSVGEVARLARVMTWKWAASDLFFGGAKAGIRFDPNSPDKEAALRAFARRLHNEVPSEYVFGLDVGLTENDAAIIQDELGDRGGAVGVPSALGGVPYDQLGITGHGVATAAVTALELQNKAVANTRVAIQGFGAVGAATAERLHEAGATVVSVSSAKGALIDANGIDIPRLMELRREYGDSCVEHYDAAVRPLGEELFVETDLLIPAATQDVIDQTNVKDIKANIIVEGANLPATPEALDALRSRDVMIVPDFIANAGGTIAAAYSMDARYSPFRPEASNILDATASKIRENVMTIIDRAREANASTHDAARSLSQERVKMAMELRNGGQPTKRR